MNIIKECPICRECSFNHFLDLNDYMITKEPFSIMSCVKCGFHFTNPIPDVSIIGNYYKSDEYVSHSSNNKGLINSLYNTIRRYTLKKKLNLVSIYAKGNNLLDIGAGTGHFLEKARKEKFNIQGLEPDKDAVNFAKSTFNIDLKPLDELYNIENESQDVITMWHVLEHVYYLNNDFNQITKTLKHNGTLIIAVPNLESYDAKHYKEFWAAYDVPRHLYHFRKKDIVNLATKYNLFLKEVYPMKFDSFYVSMLSEKYKKGSFIKAFFIGLLSNLYGKKHGYSSQIYVLQKK
jgi:2-polyprenyl-3-methyl-5-hydroxy-6-metoxy-1,4-benzoquinol methylase